LGVFRLLRQFGLGHLDHRVARRIGDFHMEEHFILTAHKTGHQANSTLGVQVHLGQVSSVDQLVVHEHPRALGVFRPLSELFLGHLDHRVARRISNFNFKQYFFGHVLYLRRPCFSRGYKGATSVVDGR